MNPEKATGFQFDEWSRLAARDPAGFEERRRAVIADFIEGCPAARRQRLRSVQWRVDRERERSATPLAACIRLSEMMWRSFAGESGLRESLRRLRAGEAAPANAKSAQVLPFRVHRH